MAVEASRSGTPDDPASLEAEMSFPWATSPHASESSATPAALTMHARCIEPLFHEVESATRAKYPEDGAFLRE